MILKNKHKDILVNIFSKTTIPVEVIAYGSRVNGTAHDGSDLDLVIKTLNHQKLQYNEFLELKQEIQESNIPILVQLLDWESIPVSFHKNILKKYEILYSSLQQISLNEPEVKYNNIK